MEPLLWKPYLPCKKRVVKRVRIKEDTPVIVTMLLDTYREMYNNGLASMIATDMEGGNSALALGALPAM
jgi:hypothetical protein